MLSESPERAVLVVLTDGHENASKEWTKARIKSRPDEISAKGWQVLFIGADFDAFAKAGSLGVSQSSTLTMSPGHYSAAMASMAIRTADYAATGRAVAFSAEDRAVASGQPPSASAETPYAVDGFEEIDAFPDLTDDGRPPRSARVERPALGVGALRIAERTSTGCTGIGRAGTGLCGSVLRTASSGRNTKSMRRGGRRRC
jgi:hypothetical protein